LPNAVNDGSVDISRIASISPVNELYGEVNPGKGGATSNDWRRFDPSWDGKSWDIDRKDHSDFDEKIPLCSTSHRDKDKSKAMVAFLRAREGTT
jgi:hypothetical protein